MEKIYNQMPYVGAAYIGIWVVMFGYLLSLGSKLSKLSKQLDVLTKTTEKK